MKNTLLAIASLVVGTCTLFGNGGAWQTGVPGTGSASASKTSQKTDVSIEDETVKIDLQPEFADVEVHYRMQGKSRRTSFSPSSAGEKIQTPIRT